MLAQQFLYVPYNGYTYAITTGGYVMAFQQRNLVANFSVCTACSLQSVAYDGANHRLYAATVNGSAGNYSSYLVAISAATNSLIRGGTISLPRGDMAFAITFAPVTNDLYAIVVPPGSSTQMVVVSPEAGRVVGNITGCCSWTGYSDDPNLLYNQLNHYIYTPYDQVIDPVTARVVANIFPNTCIVGCGQIDLSPQSGVVYYWTGDSSGTGVYWQTAAVYGIDPITNQNSSYYYIQNSSVVSGLAYDFNDSTVYSSIFGAGHGYSTDLIAINALTGTVTSLDSALPSGILSYSPSSHALYLSGWDKANTSSEAVYYIPLSSGE